MNSFYMALSIFLLLNIAAALVRVIRGPTAADRLMTAQLFGTTGMAILLVLAEAMDEPALRDVTFVFAVLAILIVICFVRTAGEADASRNTDAS